MNKVTLAKKTSFFKKLEDQDFRAIMNCLQSRLISYKKGDDICLMGDKVNYAYLILTGSARSYSYDENGNTFINIDFEKGSMFGLRDIISEKKYYTESLKALEDTDVLLLEKFRLISPCQNRCQRHITLLKACFLELGRQDEEIMFHKNLLTLSKTSDMVMTYLKHIAIKKGNVEFDIPYSRNGLATYLGVERSALSDEISKLAKKGLIEYKTNHFKLLNVDVKGKKIK